MDGVLNQPCYAMVGVAHPNCFRENYCGWLSNHEIHESFLPQNLSSIGISCDTLSQLSRDVKVYCYSDIKDWIHDQ